MEKEHNKHSSGERSGAGAAALFLLLLIDAAVYLSAGFFAQLYNLLHFDNVIPWGEYLAVLGGAFGAVFLLSVVYNRASGEWRIVRATLDALLMLSIVVGPLMLLELDPIRKGMSIYWMPTEWMKLPRALAFGARVSFPFFTAILALVIGGGFLWLRKNKFRYFVPSVLASALCMAYCLTQIQLDNRGRLYVVVLMMPVAMVSAGAALRWPRFTFRSAALMMATVSIFPFYFGLFPYFSQNPSIGRMVCALTPACDMKFGESPQTPAPGAQLIYPVEGQTPEFPMSFLRELYLDRKLGMLFSSFGPTCGFVRLDMNSGKMEVMNYRSLVRYNWSDDDIPYMLSPDWIVSDLLVIDKESFSIKKRIDLYGQGVRVPWDIQADDEHIYVLSTEPPAIARFSRATLEPEDALDFKELGYTPHSHGGYAMALDPSRNFAFMQLGIYNLSNVFKVVRINTETFETEASHDVKTGSILITPLPEQGTILMYDYYTNVVEEYEMETLKFVRSFKGVYNCRSTEYDRKRNLLYMAGSGLGELAAIDYDSGETLVKYHMGNKAGSMLYIEDEDYLIVGGGSGIYRVDLKTFAGIINSEETP